MKIVQLDSQRSWRGGEQQVLYLSQALQARGCDNVIVCQPQSALSRRATEAGLPTWNLQMRHEVDLAAAWRLGRYLKRRQVDILHMHAPHAHTIGLLARRVAPGVRLVVSRRVDFAPKRHWGSRWKYRAAGVYYLTVSDAVRHVLLSSGIPAERVRTIHSGIDVSRGDAVPDTAALFSEGTRVLGTVGHLAGHKGHAYLLEATRHLLRDEPHLGVAIVGSGDLQPALEAQAAALGIAERVRFPGFRRDVMALIRQFELFVMPSSLEGLGTSLLDAMALGKPVVATRVGGIPEVVHDGVTGLLVPPRDPVALARAIGVMLRHPELAKQFGEAGRARVARYFTAARMAERTLHVYQQLVDGVPEGEVCA
jgi:glycosyltransferase involved in cell wall biosynthesis